MTRTKPPLLARVAGGLARFFGPSGGSLKGYVNAAELLKVVVTAAAAGYGVQELLAYLVSNLDRIVRPQDLTAVTAVLVALAELYRRLRQGRPPTTPPAAPAAEAGAATFPRL